jgi:hypothetical protein
MKKVFVLLWVFVCALGGNGQVVNNKRAIRPAALAVHAVPAAVLPIRRVILYSNGVAYIERRGFINGDAGESIFRSSSHRSMMFSNRWSSSISGRADRSGQL